MTAFRVIDAEKASFDVARMAALLGVSRSGYYAWKQRQTAPAGPRAARREQLTGQIVEFHAASDGVNGSPRIHADLLDAGERVSRKTVAKLMRINGIHGISPATWHPTTTIGDGAAHSIPDLVDRRFDRGALDVVWTSDITYLRTGEGWLYLCAVRDGHSRRVIGWAIEDHLRTDLVETALRRAVSLRARDVAGVIFHADRGCQYTSTQLADVADELGVRLSVGRTGVCWDNAQQESFWSTLKTEYYDRSQWPTKHLAALAVGAWIEMVYNRRRRHTRLGMRPPATFEEQHPNAAQAA